jgi:molybdopterin-guanine dinucleotide biosynthesis protein MobB
MAHTWIQIVGTKKTGKTTLIEALTRELVRRGRRVCYIKHTHSDPGFDNEDTDTAKLREAGATTAVLAAANSTIVVHHGDKDRIGRLTFRDALPGEIVLAEGFKSAPGRKVALAGGDLDIGALDGVVAVITGGPKDDGSASDADTKGLRFSIDQTREICDLIEKLATTKTGETWATRLFIDGEEVELNAFVQDVMASALLGMSTCLKGVEAGTELEFRCTRIGANDKS